VCSRIGAVAALVGSALGAAGGLCAGVPTAAITSGRMGFNASLAFTAMFFFYAPSKGSLVLGVFAAFMTVAAQQALAALLEPWGLPFMTLPFCVATLPFVILQGTASIVIAIPLASMTVPEDHVRRVRALDDGISFLMDSIHKSGRSDDDGDLIADNRSGGAGGSHKGSRRHLTGQLFVSERFSRHMTRSLSELSGAIQENRKAATSEKEEEYIPRQSRVLRRSSNIWTEGGNWDEGGMRQRACCMFYALDTSRKGSLRYDQVTNAFKTCGLTDPEGLHFATLVLKLLDLDRSNTIERDEFIAFALVSRSIRTIRRKISRFFDFVDEAGTGMVNFDDIDCALEYLGQNVMSDEDKDKIVKAFSATHGGDGDATNGYIEMDIVELINFSIFSKVQEFVSLYHHKQMNTVSFDPMEEEDEVSA